MPLHPALKHLLLAISMTFLLVLDHHLQLASIFLQANLFASPFENGDVSQDAQGLTQKVSLNPGKQKVLSEEILYAHFSKLSLSHLLGLGSGNQNGSSIPTIAFLVAFFLLIDLNEPGDALVLCPISTIVEMLVTLRP